MAQSRGSRIAVVDSISDCRLGDRWSAADPSVTAISSTACGWRADSRSIPPPPSPHRSQSQGHVHFHSGADTMADSENQWLTDSTCGVRIAELKCGHKSRCHSGVQHHSSNAVVDGFAGLTCSARLSVWYAKIRLIVPSDFFD